MTPTPDWKDALCYSTPSFHEHSVNGKIQNFYPVSVGLLFKLKRTAKELTKAISDVFVSINKDIKITDSTTTNTIGGVERIVVQEPISLAMAQYRDKQRADAWATGIDAFTDDETMKIIAEIIIDVLADVFPKDANGIPAAPTTTEFLKATKLPTLIQMLVGVAKGNQDVFGPLGSKASSFLSSLEKLATTKVTELVEAKINPPTVG